MIIVLLGGSGHAEQGADFSGILDFSREYNIHNEIQQLIDVSFSGEIKLKDIFSDFLKAQLRRPLETVRPIAAGLFLPVLLLAVLGSVLPAGSTSGSGIAFLLRMMVMLCCSRLAAVAVSQAEVCLQTVKRFTDICAPALTAILAAMGLESGAALISPAATLAGETAQNVFLQYGLPLCRIGLCTAIAGNLSGEMDLSGFTALLKKAANWIVGLSTALFTALLALQGSVSEGLDGVAVRTAKFAADSAAPVIGSGVSDVWDSYISGLMISRNALGISGIAALALACAYPILLGLFCMAALLLLSAMLELFGEKLCARSAGQISGVCQMAISLCTGALSIATILLGAVMSMGKELF